MTCKKLLPDRICRDNPGIRCVHVPTEKCKPELTDSTQTTQKTKVGLDGDGKK